MIISVPREVVDGETRVALVPESVRKLVVAGINVRVQTGAGEAAGVSDEEYTAAGAELVSDTKVLFAEADFVLKVQPPTYNAELGAHEATLLKSGAMLLTTLSPLANLDTVTLLKDQNVTAFSTDCVPRITRAQSMDILSSMATVAGYKAVLIAAVQLGKFMPMMMTAAGTIRPAKVFIMGAGVAGLVAIGTARRLGAVVEATDVRPAVKEQVESLGAKFISPELPKDAEVGTGYAKEMTPEFLAKQRDMNTEVCKTTDALITTAQVFGRKAPILVTEEMVKVMPLGSVIVDLAAEQGGNCACTVAGQTVVRHGVTIIGATNLAATTPIHASQMYSRNLTTFVLEFTKNGEFNLDLNDEILKGCIITHKGEVLHELTKKALATT